MLVIALCTACVFRANVNKKLCSSLPIFRFGPTSLNALAPALSNWNPTQVCFYNTAVKVSLKFFFSKLQTEILINDIFSRTRCGYNLKIHHLEMKKV